MRAFYVAGGGTPGQRGTTAHGAVAQCLGSGVLQTILQPETGLAIWTRPCRRPPLRAVQALLDGPAFSHVASGPPEAATRALMRQLPADARPLGQDISLLAVQFARLVPDRRVRLRLEHLRDDACRLFHVDAVRLRLLCTYSGQGTEWLSEDDTLHRMAVMQAAVFKGTRHPDAAPRVRHRSPPVSMLPPPRRARLLLCIDETGIFQ